MTEEDKGGLFIQKIHITISKLYYHNLSHSLFVQYNIIKQIVFHTFQMVHASYMHNKYIKKILITFSTINIVNTIKECTLFILLLCFLFVFLTPCTKKNHRS